MNVVKDLQSLIQLMHSREEVIIFPIGGEGYTLLESLRYMNLLNRVCCIAAAEVDGGFAQKFIHELPIIPFENLLHFRETALLIVATSDQSQNSNLDSEIKRFGFKSVVFTQNNVHDQVRIVLQKLYDSGQILMWYMRNFDKKLNDLELVVEEQNELSAVNTNAFSEYKNAFRGKKVVIVGTGPTAKYYIPIQDAIHIGLNQAWRIDNISFDYFFSQNATNREIIKAFKGTGFGRIKQKIFLGKFLNRSDDNWITFPEEYSLWKDNIHRYFLGIPAVGQKIFQDICHHTIANFNTIALPTVHFALFTYPSEIYLVGCDTTSGRGHFYDNDNKKQSLATGNVKVGYARMKMFAKQYYPETEIISINPIGLRGLFKDIYTEEYKVSLD